MTTGLILPEARNRGAKLVVQTADRITPNLPAGIDPQHFLYSAIAEANTNCAECDPVTVAKAVFNCAVLGLIPGPTLGHAYLIPFKGVCTLVPGYKGFLELAFSNRFLRTCHAEVILAGEDFEQWVDRNGPQVNHRIPLDRNLAKSDVAGAYCVYETTSGGHGVVVVTRKEIDRIDTGKNVWRSDYVAMCKKTAVRRASKEWKTTLRLAQAVTLDEQAERGETQAQLVDADLLPPKPAMSLKSLAEDDHNPKPGESVGSWLERQIQRANAADAPNFIEDVQAAQSDGEITAEEAGRLNTLIANRMA